MTVRDLIMIAEDMDRVSIRETYEAFVWGDEDEQYSVSIEEGKEYVEGVDFGEDAELQTLTSSVFTGLACEVPIRYGEKIIRHIGLDLEEVHGRRRDQVKQRPVLRITI